MENISLSLDHTEAKLLREALESYLSDLRLEITDIESGDLQEQLKAEEAGLGRLLAQIS